MHGKRLYALAYTVGGQGQRTLFVMTVLAVSEAEAIGKIVKECQQRGDGVPSVVVEEVPRRLVDQAYFER